MKSAGVVCGRFQIFHNEHLNYILSAKKECNYLIIGITSPNGAAGRLDGASDNRGKKAANPCTFFERMSVIRNALLAVGLKREEFDIVPYPIEQPELVHCYIPNGICHFITILDHWGECKKQIIEEQGYPVKVLWRNCEKKISSTLIRQAIYDNKEWRQYVPKETYQYIISHKIDERIKALMNNES